MHRKYLGLGSSQWTCITAQCVAQLPSSLISVSCSIIWPFPTPPTIAKIVNTAWIRKWVCRSSVDTGYRQSLHICQDHWLNTFMIVLKENKHSVVSSWTRALQSHFLQYSIEARWPCNNWSLTLCGTWKQSGILLVSMVAWLAPTKTCDKCYSAIYSHVARGLWCIVFLRLALPKLSW